MAHWCGKKQTSVTLQYKLNTAHHTMPCTQMYGTQNTDCQCDCSHDAGIAGHTQLQSTLNFVTRGFVASMFLSNCRSKESTSEVKKCAHARECACEVEEESPLKLLPKWSQICAQSRMQRRDTDLLLLRCTACQCAVNNNLHQECPFKHGTHNIHPAPTPSSTAP